MASNRRFQLALPLVPLAAASASFGALIAVVSLVLFSSPSQAADDSAEFIKIIQDDSAEMQTRDGAVKMLAQTKDGATKLIALNEKGELPDELKASAALALAGSPDAEVRKAAEAKLPMPASKEGKPLPSVAKLVDMKGDAKSGKTVFESPTGPNCISCHQVGANGRFVGPPLDAIGEKPKDVLYETILSPSAAVQHGFDAYTIKLKSGGVRTGIIADENDERISLRDNQGETIDIPISDIQKKTKQKQSLMPEGLVKTMTVQELVDLVEYLASLKVNQ